MTQKCCSGCEHLGQSNLPQTGKICRGIPNVGLLGPVIKNTSLDTFYCAAFLPRRNSAKLDEEKQKPLPTSIEEAQEDERYERAETWPYVRRKPTTAKKVGGKEDTADIETNIPPIQRRFV